MFMANDDPMYVSEHRESFQNTEEMPDIMHPQADMTLYGISAPRLALAQAADKLKADHIACNIVHIAWLKPFEATARLIDPLKHSGMGLVVDATFEICGAARSIAYELTQASGVPVRALGLLDRTKCLCPPLQNKAPDADGICRAVKNMLRNK